ncbi:MAG: branched-chain amino acid ABC transporter permease [Desulfurococcales archaeon]|nr:branched-chain amino acid ABC transporter permease [Desulfurococcales archaeon]
MVSLESLVTVVEQILAFAAVYYILTAALNVKAGMTGIPDFGHAMFFAVGGIVVGNLVAHLVVAIAILTGFIGPEEVATITGKPGSPSLGMVDDLVLGNNEKTLNLINNEYLPNSPLTAITMLLVAIALSLVLGGALGFIASYPALRLRGEYLAIMLLTASEGIRVLVTYTPQVMGATPTVGLFKPRLFAWTPDPPLAATLFAVLVALLVYLFVESFYNSPSGRLFRAVRDDEDTAKAVGKNIAAVRRDAMILGGALAALAGLVYSLNPWLGGSSVAAQSIFDRVLWTFWPWALMILGGMASNRGVTIATIIVGALVIGPIRIYKDDIARLLPLEYVGIDEGYFANALEYMLIALLMLAVIYFRPRGVIPEPPSRTLSLREIEEVRRKVLSSKEG